jgi:two-component system, cell cycle response regulator
VAAARDRADLGDLGAELAAGAGLGFGPADDQPGRSDDVVVMPRVLLPQHTSTPLLCYPSSQPAVPSSFRSGFRYLVMASVAPFKSRTRPRALIARAVEPRLFMATAGCLLVLEWVHAASGFGGVAAEDFFSRWMYLAIGAAASIALSLRGLQRRGLQRAWLVLGVGLLSKTVGDVIYSLAGNLGTVPTPSVSDGFWLAFYPSAYLSLLLLVRGRIASTLAATRLDGVICGVTVAAAMACATLPTAFSNSAGAPFWEKATDLAYPIGDLVLMGAVVSAVALSGWRIDRTLGVLGAAIVAWEVADVAYLFGVGGTAGDVADALVLTGAAGMALAAILDRQAKHRDEEGDRGLFVPVVFGGVALAILICGAALQLELVGLLLAAAALGLVLTRMALALAENRALLGVSRAEATTDALTGLGNRRKLKEDLSNTIGDISAENPFALVILDLNGFKTYNDSFGHAAGDMLLARLGASLAAAADGYGKAYRLGGDEFCVLAACGERESERLSSACARALASRGEGFSITAAHGVVMLPSEARDPSNALALADARMYGNKASAGRPHTAGELTRVLTAVLEGRAPTLADRSNTVCDLAIATGVHLGLSDDELEAIRHAAPLHDIGKMAIPDSILEKAGPLSEDEWQLMRQHTIIGERILAAAPALQYAAQLVRSSHERYDGNGYPDGLRADEIPVTARIIAVADAFGAMTAPRPYKRTLTVPEALAELQRCAGSQFDPQAIAAFQRALTNTQLSEAA